MEKRKTSSLHLTVKWKKGIHSICLLKAQSRAVSYVAGSVLVAEFTLKPNRPQTLPHRERKEGVQLYSSALEMNIQGPRVRFEIHKERKIKENWTFREK